MRTIEKEKVTTTKYEIFVANDGTEFKNREECKKYEESAKGVLNEKYRKLVVGETDEDSFFGIGCCDDVIEIVRIQSEKDADAVKQMFFFYNGEYVESNHETEYYRCFMNLVERAKNENDYLLIGRGYEGDSFWAYGTRNSLKEKIDNRLNNLIAEKTEK